MFGAVALVAACHANDAIANALNDDATELAVDAATEFAIDDAPAAFSDE